MKRVFKITIIILLTIFSFFYTNRAINLSKKNDPIMLEIINSKDLFEIAPVNGIIDQNGMLVGKSGKTINVNTSYERMKKFDKYNEALLTYVETKPSIIMSDNYDKLITGVNTSQREISLVFNVNRLDYLNEIVYILNKNNVIATFFIDGKNLEEFKPYIKNDIYTGLYSYNDIFNSTSILYMKNYLSKNFNYSEYCLYKDDSFLNVCKETRINTIDPIKVEKDIYNYFKNDKKNGFIYEIKVTKDNIRKLNSTIMYLKEKGYEIKSLDDLLKE